MAYSIGEKGTKQNQTFWGQNRAKTQRKRHIVTSSYLVIIAWLGRVEMFQTFQTEISDENYVRLQRILEEQNGHTYMLEEVKEIGDGLLSFFNLLIEMGNKAEECTE